MKKITVTTEYNQFRFVKGNRPLNDLHLSKLRKSMNENFLPIPIIVNESMEIVDGQHRFTICKELNLPIHYIAGQNWNISEIRQINSVQKSWTYHDFIKSYMDLEKGVGPYTTLDWFIKTYNIPTQSAITILTDSALSARQLNDFKSGNLKINNLPWAKEFCTWLVKHKAVFSAWNKRGYVHACIILDKDRRFIRAKWLKQLFSHSMKMRHCTTIDDYLDLIEYVYNVGTRQADRIRFQREGRKWNQGKFK